MNNIFLGKPPASIKKWIIDHSGPDLSKPLCFTAADAGATIALKCNGNNLKTATFETSPTGEDGSWTDYTYAKNITLANAGDKIYFRAKTDNTSIARNPSNYLQFTTSQATKKVDVSGNAMSLLAPEFKDLLDLSTIKSGSAEVYLFYRLFYKCKSIKSCKDLSLPATKLANYCYYSMFSGCTSLTAAPEIKTYEPDFYAFDRMLNELKYDESQTLIGWGDLTSCNWPDLTLSEVESMILNDGVFGYNDGNSGVRISITCKDGSGVAYFDPNNQTWVFEY